MNDFVNLFEVGPRDGLQNEQQPLEVVDKVKLIDELSNSGLKKIEAGSFVSPKWVPQMASSGEVFEKIARADGVLYTALTPNLKGFEHALAASVDEVAIFGAASESFSQRNINCSIEKSMDRFKPVIEAAKANNIPVRGYVSCVVGCPYEGNIDAAKVANVSKALFEMGCYEISLGDTIGIGNPRSIKSMLNAVMSEIPAERLAIHCHDTYGRALANICTSLDAGIRTIDSSVAGLGGCPYAHGASGNVATEDVVDLLLGLGLESGVNLDQIIQIGNSISHKLGRSNQSKVSVALSK